MLSHVFAFSLFFGGGAVARGSTPARDQTLAIAVTLATIVTMLNPQPALPPENLILLFDFEQKNAFLILKKECNSVLVDKVFFSITFMKVKILREHFGKEYVTALFHVISDIN